MRVGSELKSLNLEYGAPDRSRQLDEQRVSMLKTVDCRSVATITGYNAFGIFSRGQPGLSVRTLPHREILFHFDTVREGRSRSIIRAACHSRPLVLRH